MLSNVVHPSVAQTLKHQTAEQHGALEAVMMPYLTDISALPQYAHLLKAFYGYMQPVEAAIAQHLHAADVPDMARRRKADVILKDLAALSIFDNIVTAENLPVIKDKHQAMGALYVLEGSTLGGRGIIKMLLRKECLQLTSHQIQFFGGYGDATGTMWTSFIKVLNNWCSTEDELETMVAAANQTFLYFKIWLQKELKNGSAEEL